NVTGKQKLDRGLCMYFRRVESKQHLVAGGKLSSCEFVVLLVLRQIVAAKNYVLSGHGDRLSICRRKDVVRCKHQHASLDLRFGRQRDVHRHLVTVKVGVESSTHKRMNLDRFAFNQHRLECLNTQTVERWSSVQ